MMQRVERERKRRMKMETKVKMIVGLGYHSECQTVRLYQVLMHVHQALKKKMRRKKKMMMRGKRKEKKDWNVSEV